MKTSRLIILLPIVMLTVLANAQIRETEKAKTNIAELLTNKARVLKTLDKSDANYDETIRYPWGNQKNIFVLDDRIVFRRKKESTIIYFADLANYEIYLTTDEKDNAGAIIGEFLILLDGKENGVKLANNLIFIKDQILIETKKKKSEKMEKLYGPQLILFEPIAAHYKALKMKPPVSEEQRRFIVQANSFNEQKDYYKAIELYHKAITIDQTSYPAAYSNLALLSAQVSNFYEAIFYMKKYLMLEPDADDARSAQDKIYLWEARLGD